MRHGDRVWLGVALLLFAALSVTGITWGLPGRAIDKYLFDGNAPWPGEKIFRLAGAHSKFNRTLGADVDVDPRAAGLNGPVRVTATEEDVARIYLRYRLYTHQPDEMITMMALAGMEPGRLDLDPRMYQYGGLFIYPVGALLGLGGAVGLIDLRGDPVYYLDNPDEFGKFYVAARAYSAAWGLVGVCAMFGIAGRLGGPRAGFVAALLYTLMPVVICMAHEGKPHLPGAVLMSLAVLFAMRHLSIGAGTRMRTAAQSASDSPRAAAGELTAKNACASSRDWWMMCVFCAAAFGMVLSSWPILVLIPLIVLLEETADGAPSPEFVRGGSAGARRTGDVNATARAQKAAAGRWRRMTKRTLPGAALALLVYAVTNPYLFINAFLNREVLRSNFGNSLAMYEIARIGEGFVRVAELSVEGASLPIVVLGVVALILALARRSRAIMPLAVPAGLFAVQFVLIGAGKPAEYGRFGVFADMALAVGTACLLARPSALLGRRTRYVIAALVIIWTGSRCAAYVRNFRIDAGPVNSRTLLAAEIRKLPAGAKVAVVAEPAPYGCPPLNFSAVDVRLIRAAEEATRTHPGAHAVIIEPVDRMERGARADGEASAPGSDETPISWANKPFRIVRMGRGR